MRQFIDFIGVSCFSLYCSSLTPCAFQRNFVGWPGVPSKGDKHLSFDDGNLQGANTTCCGVVDSNAENGLLGR